MSCAQTATEVLVTDDLAELESASRRLADSVRRLIDATIRTQVDAAALVEVSHAIDCATEELSAAIMPSSFGVQATEDGRPMAWGNVMIGLRNAVAPPLVVNRGSDGAGVERLHPRRGLRGSTRSRARRGVRNGARPCIGRDSAQAGESRLLPGPCASVFCAAHHLDNCVRRPTSTAWRVPRPSPSVT